MTEASMNEVSFVAKSGAGLAKLKAKVGKIKTAEISQFDLLEIAPDAFIRIEIRRIAGQAFQEDAFSRSLSQKISTVGPAMGGQAIPNDQQLTGDKTQQMLQEPDKIRALEGMVLCQSEQPPLWRNGANDRQVVAAERDTQHGRASDWRIGPGDGGQPVEPGFVHEHYGSSFLDGFFSSSGQRPVRHCSMAASWRWAARFNGFWLLQRMALSNRPTCTVENRTPKVRSMTSAIRARVHTSPRKPKCSAPCSNSAGSCSICSLLSRACGWPLLCLRKAASPASSALLIHWLTSPSLTPSASAMSFCFQPFCFSSPARNRRISRHSSSSFFRLSFMLPVYLFSPLFFSFLCFAQ